MDNIFKKWEDIETAMVAKFAKYFPKSDEIMKTEDKEIGNDVTILIYTPPDYPGGKPIFVHIHAGGRAMGGLNTDYMSCRILSQSAGVVLLSVNYRQRPPISILKTQSNA